MIGKTNSKQGAPAAQETVNIRLISNQSEHSGLVGTKFTLSYGAFKKEYTWSGNEVSAQIPAHVTYSVEFGDAEGYNTPEPIIYEAVEDNARTIEAVYTCELLTVNVDADEGTPEGYEVSIYKGDKINLPSGYTFLEYIESTGTQYINTGFYPNNNSRVIMDAQMTSSGNSQFLFGTRTASATSNFSFLIASASFRSDYRESKINLSSPTTLTDRMKVDKNKNVLYIDGISKVTNSTSTFTCQYPLFICASPDGNISSPKYFGSMRIYSCQIYDNGKLVRDYVPVINSNGIAGLYDMTNNMFYPSDSSTNFVAGTKINNSFTKLEYIESNGNQYIDTEFKPNQNTRVISDFQMTSSSGSQFVYGARNSSYVQAFGFLISSTTNTFRASYGSANTNVNITFLNRYTCDQNKNICSVGGVTVDLGTAIFSSQYNMFLFSGNKADTSEARGNLKMYSCKIYDNGLLVRDFIPVLRYDGSVGLYDKVNTKFYASASGTNFIAGDEVNLVGETIAVQTTATGSYKIPYGTEYSISASKISGFETPATITRNASEASFVANIEYKKIGVRDLSLFDVYGNPINRSTANCYVVREAGQYKFPLVYGNTIKNGKVNTAAFTNNGGSYSHDFDDSYGHPIKSPYIEYDGIPSLINRDANDIIANISLVEGSDCKYIQFDVLSVPSVGANAIISYNEEGLAFWSWHIWLWPHDLSPVEITNATGVKYNIMPVNLASKYDSDGVHIKNWFYQWGRKDPMLCPSSYNSDTNHSPGYIYIDSRSSSLSSSIELPERFYRNSGSPYNWFGDKSYYNLWDAACTSTGSSDNDTVKTVYDPCPVGWKVPNGNVFTGFSTSNVVGSFANGWKFKRYSGDTVGVFFPASGCRRDSSGSLYGVGSDGGVWLSSAYSQDYAYYLLFTLRYVNPKGYTNRAYGFSVRPVQDDNIQLDVIMISFKIETTTYQAESGMTWFEWVNSDYNTAGCTISGSNVMHDGLYVFLSSVARGAANYVKITDNIVGGGVYISA